MQEEAKNPIDDPSSLPVDGSVDQPDAHVDCVTIACGVYSERLPVAGSTVGEIRARYSERLGIHPRNQAVLDGRAVGEDTVVGPGETLTFVCRAGEMGCDESDGTPPPSPTPR